MQQGGKLYQIEGLRGLAILFIILFHLCPETFPMGFLGVEVFLVITGYLLFAKPFRKEQETLGDASGRFLNKKLKRLMIPLAALVLCTMMLCFGFLTPEDYKLTATTGLFSLIGASNFYLHKVASDYFSADVSFCPLTHTWYLAVIIQVYLLYLVGNLVSAKWPAGVKRGILAAVGLFSLAWFGIGVLVDAANSMGWEWHMGTKPDYYGATGRLWEVLAGAAIPFLPDIKSDKLRGFLPLLALAVLVFLLAESFYIERTGLVVCAVICTAVIIRYASGNAAYKLLTWRVLLKTGMVSFSLYLVHFPLIVCYHCVQNDNTPAGVVILLLLIGIAGYLFYRFVESRTFTWKQSLIPAVGALTLAGAGLASPNAFLWRSSDFEPCRYTRELKAAPESWLKGFDTSVLGTFFDIEKFTERKGKCKHPILQIGAEGAGTPAFVFMGDSHAAALFPGLDTQCRQHGISALYTKTYVVPFSQWEMTRGWKGEREKALLHWLSEHPELRTVVIAQYWQNRFEDRDQFHASAGSHLSKEEALRQFVQEIKALGKQVILVSSAPGIQSTSIPRDYRLYCRSGSFAPRLGLLSCTVEDYRRDKGYCEGILQKLEDEGLCRVLHIERGLFNGAGVFEGVKDGTKYMFDSHHLSPAGACKAMEACMNDLLQALGE